MSRQVLFNGVVLIRPGAATKIDASQFQNIALSGLGTIGLIGEAVGGEPRTVQVFLSAKGVKDFYKSGDLVEAAQIAASPGNDPRIPSGAQVIVCYKVNNSTQSALAYGTAHALKSRQYGVLTNSITAAFADGVTPVGSRIITITDVDDFGALKVEVSPIVGGGPKFTLQYTGAGTAATVTITATQLTTAVTGGPGGENLTLNFSDFPSLNDLVKYIDALAGYTATANVANANSFDPSNLDALTTADIKTAPVGIKATNWDISDWINTNSSIISDTLTKGITSTLGSPVLTQTAFAGGTRGTSDNTAWTTGFTAMRTTRVNQVVPLASKNGTTEQGTFTISSILAALVAHAKYASSTAGRNEVQAWAGVEMTKTNLIAEANTHNSEHLMLIGQKPKLPRVSDGSIVTFPEWAYAVALAGMRCGAPLGEPLTWKYVNTQGQTQDASWSPDTDDDVKSLLLNGLCVVVNIKGKGFRLEKGITTFIKMDNDAYTEETIVQTWKAVSFDLRTALEDIFVGRPGDVNTVRQVPAVVIRVLEQFRRAGSITDSIIGGVTIPAYRDITVDLNGDQLVVGVTISPTPGINFVLNTIVIVPARISLAA